MRINVILSIFVIALCFWTSLSVTTKCSRLLSKIPVHRNFDVNKFLGTWYTVSRTTLVWGEKTFESGTIAIAKNPDSTLAYSYTGKSGSICAPVETGMLEPGKRLGEFTMKGPGSVDPHMIVSFTDYHDIALVFFCFKFRGIQDSTCRPEGGQVEIMVRSMSAMDKVAAYTTRAKKRLCANTMMATDLGDCEIPDIMEAARKETILTDNTASKPASTNDCIVNNVPIQANFNITQMSGLWYEIARTRHTFNKMENIVSYHKYDNLNNRIESFYTGTVPSTTSEEENCVTPLKGTSKPKSADGPHGDILGRIGGEDSAYPWSPMKVLYADDNYLMFYACYTGQKDEPCQQQGTEVSIMGRSYGLDTESRDKLYALLPNVCTDPEDLLMNVITANCSSHVLHTSEDDQDHCMLKDIPVYDDYSKVELRGRWYLYAYITNASAALYGVVMDISVVSVQGEEPVDTSLVAFAEEHGDIGTCREYQSRQRERCLDTANRITTVPFYETTNFVFSKVLHLADNLLIEYVCTKLNVAGYCDLDGVIFNVYKNMTETTDAVDDEQELDLINKLAQSVCLNPEQLEFETDWCTKELNFTSESHETDDCDIDIMVMYSDVENFNQEDLYGYWYLLYRSNGTKELEDLDSLVAHFSSEENETLSIHYTGCYNESECSDVMTASVLVRCPLDPVGDYLLRYKSTEYAVAYAPFKVLYLEKENVLTTYVCQHVLPDGRCHESGGQVRIWGRNTTIPEYMTDIAMDMVYWACIDPNEPGFMLSVSHNNIANSTDTLRNYVTEYVQILEPESEQRDKAEKPQKEETPDDDDDLEAELLMSDEEFYGYS